jgi:hypothetical protein
VWLAITLPAYVAAVRAIIGERIGILLALGFIYDFPVLAIPLAFIMRLGLRDGFLPYELPGIALACGLILAFPFLAIPTGFIAAVVVAALVARRAAAEYRGQLVLRCGKKLRHS